MTRAQSQRLMSVAISFFVFTSSRAPSQEDADAGFLLRLDFQPAVSKQVQDELQAKGMVQRETFSGLLERSRKNMQIAFVLDGTESMGKDITSVFRSLRGFVGDLKRSKGKGSKVEFGLVVYRDSGARSGRLAFPMDKSFSGEIVTIERALGKIRPETGAPRFNELVDVGLHAALEQLKWTLDDDTSRWIILFGDAPPYPDGYREEANNTGRYYPTRDLTELAMKQSVKISCILCSSGFVGGNNPKLKATFQDALPETQSFMKELSDSTGGVFWDLSRPDLQQALVKAAKQQQLQEQTIAHISVSDLTEAVAAANSNSSPQARDNRVRLAVLPHMPMREMEFSADHEEVQVATALGSKFSLIPSIEVSNPQVVATRFSKVESPDDGNERLLHGLAKQLRVDYVLWGSLSELEDRVSLQSACYKRVDGEKLAEASESTSKGNELGERHLASIVAERLAQNIATSLRDEGADTQLIETFARVKRSDELGRAVASPISSNLRAQREMLAGFDSLQRALAFPKDSQDAAELLSSAELKLKAGLFQDPQNAWAHALLASCYFNQAEVDTANDKMQMFYKALQTAYDCRENVTTEALRREIEADYALFCQEDPDRAIVFYQSLADSADPVPLHLALRAHWMLAGIYCGDWQVARSVVNAQKAREHIVQILALWPDSPEAQFYRDALNYDDQLGTQSSHLPTPHDDFPKPEK